MKNFFLFLLIAAIIAGMSYGVYKYFFDYEQTYIDDVVAEGALVYVKASAIKDNIDRIGATKLWKEISKVDYRSLMKEAGADKKQIMMADLIISQLGSKNTKHILEYFFNDEVALLIYPSDLDLSKISDFSADTAAMVIEKLLTNVALVFRVGEEVQFVDAISQIFNNFGAKIERGQIKHNNHTLYVIKVPDLGLEINYAKIDDVIIAGIGDVVAKRSYEVLDGKIPPLSKDARFTQASEKFTLGSDLEIYLNINKSLDLLHAQARSLVTLIGQQTQKAIKEDDEGGDAKKLQENVSLAQSRVDEFFKQLAGFNSVAASTKWEGIYESNFFLFFDKAQLSAEVAKTYACPASENKSINFIPEDVVVYQWANCLDLADIWGQMQKQIDNLPNADAQSAQIAAIEQSLGINIKDDIIPTFAGEFGGYLKGINVGFLFPIPDLLLFIETKDRVKANRLMDIIIKQAPLEIKQENYSGSEFKYFITPFGEAIQPSYCFLGSHLLISASKDSIKKSIDAYNETSLSLVSNPGFRSVNIGLTDINRGVQFVSMDKFIKEIRSVINWVNVQSSTRDEKQLAFKRGVEMKLTETRGALEELKNEVSALEKDYTKLEDEIWDIESIGTDVSEKRAELKALDQKIKDKKNDVATLAGQESELKINIEELGEESVAQNLRKQLMDKAAFPILNGLESIKAVGTRFTIDQNKGFIESNMYVDIDE
ncbi:MAG: hypothetical protein A2Y03_09400 [Omnitrophica WOR_2 bacterium GWF2_38_59]|nr:MAG: hypothetical protein A2Y03_09400 [Omnitrophica WOR_2 bacterium GWF2_38_59]OGX54127.1 MAG: hypothetical protein A2267_09105 [Omnitrophica WOR_2 bacterium RIFOXYA12_FULL_38_10]OGX56161.1 MAG: hypothetical protein A2447_07840 [Omnitrophica WOR_2 bacterium RIFOXYC2_FULL_38_12]OGX60404.1 MAG: hypothetical protein A2306_09120 [Omnitrophica WOR_2 bacterium RIFOXYB2_FULL_38_16]HBG60924.1 hypothetical protein [Candidatus Omnitrophota bacterium]